MSAQPVSRETPSPVRPTVQSTRGSSRENSPAGADRLGVQGFYSLLRLAVLPPRDVRELAHDARELPHGPYERPRDPHASPHDPHEMSARRPAHETNHSAHEATRHADGAAPHAREASGAARAGDSGKAAKSGNMNQARATSPEDTATDGDAVSGKDASTPTAEAKDALRGGSDSTRTDGSEGTSASGGRCVSNGAGACNEAGGSGRAGTCSDAGGSSGAGVPGSGVRTPGGPGASGIAGVSVFAGTTALPSGDSARASVPSGHDVNQSPRESAITMEGRGAEARSGTEPRSPAEARSAVDAPPGSVDPSAPGSYSLTSGPPLSALASAVAERAHAAAQGAEHDAAPAGTSSGDSSSTSQPATAREADGSAAGSYDGASAGDGGGASFQGMDFGGSGSADADGFARAAAAGAAFRAESSASGPASSGASSSSGGPAADGGLAAGMGSAGAGMASAAGTTLARGETTQSASASSARAAASAHDGPANASITAQRHVLDQVVSHLAVRRLGEGATEAVVRLHPESLGQVEIRLRLEQGHLTAQFAAAGEEAREALRRHLPDLQRALAQHPAGPGSVSVEIGRNFQGGEQTAGGRPMPGRRSAATAPNVARPGAGHPTAPRGGRPGRLDLYA